jgi:protein SCO1/2
MADCAGAAAMKRLLGLGVLVAAGFALGAARSGPVPDPALYSYQEHPGAQVPAQSVFRDSDGRALRMGELSQGTPLILILGYFHCSSLCGIVRASLFRALPPTGLKAGRDYTLAVLSIDPTEVSAQAQAAKAADLSAFGSLGAERYWHYLTGSAKEIKAVTNAVGFRDRFDQQTQQFIHPAGIIFVTPDGMVSNYLLGVGYTPAAVRAAVERAGAGRVAVAGSPLLLICFHFDPATGRYSLETLKVLRLAGLLTVFTLATVLYLLCRREQI